MKMAFRAPDDVAAKIEAYVAVNDMGKTEAIVRLITLGLSVETGSLMTDEQARIAGEAAGEKIAEMESRIALLVKDTITKAIDDVKADLLECFDDAATEAAESMARAEAAAMGAAAAAARREGISLASVVKEGVLVSFGANIEDAPDDLDAELWS